MFVCHFLRQRYCAFFYLMCARGNARGSVAAGKFAHFLIVLYLCQVKKHCVEIGKHSGYQTTVWHYRQ